MPFAPLVGTDLYYETHGSGPPLVFAHGVGGNHASWYQQIPFFARWHTVVVFDHRGFGNSRLDRDGQGADGHIPDLLALLDHLGIEQAALVAQSMGGWTCLGAAMQAPARVRALVLADTTGGFLGTGALAERIAAAGAATRDLPQLERVLARDFPLRQPARAALYSQIASFNQLDRRTLRRTTPPPEADLARLTMPTLMLAGSEDILFPPDIIRAMAALVPGAQYVEIQDAGHSVYFEQPEAFNQAVLRFLRAVEDGKR